MSYILDALRRADAERERGAVPGLHTQPVAGLAAGAGARGASGPWLAAGAGGAVLLLGAAGWWLLQRPAPAPMAVVATAPAPQPSVLPAAAPPSAAPAPPAVVALPTPGAASRPSALPLATVASPRLPSPAAAAPAVATAASDPAASAATTARIVPWEQLPDDVRRRLPALAIGGAIYSDSAASRMLIVGGQLLHEGDAAAPGVVLEQIRQRSAVLRWRDLRYEVGY